MQTSMIILGICIIIVLLNLTTNRTKTEHLYIANSGDYKGQMHNIKDWRRIAIELAKNTKNSKLNAMAKHGTDEDVIGLLYMNFGVELLDYEEN